MKRTTLHRLEELKGQGRIHADLQRLRDMHATLEPFLSQLSASVAGGRDWGDNLVAIYALKKVCDTSVVSFAPQYEVAHS